MKSGEEGQDEQNVGVGDAKEDPKDFSTSPDLKDQFQSNYLEKCGKWLESLPRDDMLALRETSEYRAFLRAFEQLGRAHHRVVTLNQKRMEVDYFIGSENISPDSSKSDNRRERLIASFSFLQRMVVDDVILRIMEYLPCISLIKLSATCSRFRELANESATQRTHEFASSRKLNQVMQLLRAKEQIEGVGSHSPAVRVPMLGLARRVMVTNAGDPEYNGVYHCTSHNGNGFVFTKARNSFSRVPLNRASYAASAISNPTLPPLDAHGRDGQVPVDMPDYERLSHYWDDEFEPGRLLRCVIAKRFSNEVSVSASHVSSFRQLDSVPHMALSDRRFFGT